MLSPTPMQERSTCSFVDVLFLPWFFTHSGAPTRNQDLYAAMQHSSLNCTVSSEVMVKV